MPMDWDKLRIFHAVAEAGSFTTAGARLNSSQSAVSRQIKTLEESLNVALFTRHARGLVLTSEGQQLFNTTSNVSRKIEATQHDLMESKGRPFGELRITTMVTFGAVWLTPHLSTFMEQYPELNIKLILDDEDLDLSAGQADVAIRLHEPSQNDLIQRPLAQFHNHIYASPEYLDRMGTPSEPEELDNHDIISCGARLSTVIKGLEWSLTVGTKGGRKRVPRLEVNNLYGVMHAVEQGMGLAVLPDYLVHNNSRLVRLFRELPGHTFPSYFCYPPELRGSKRVAVIRDFLIQAIRADSNIL